MSDISLARLSNFFSSVSGVDKGYRFVVYFLKIIAVNLTETRGKDSPIVQNINALVNPLGNGFITFHLIISADTRMILRFFGLIPILDSLTKRQSDQVVKSDAEKLLAFIEKAQNWYKILSNIYIDQKGYDGLLSSRTYLLAWGS